MKLTMKTVVGIVLLIIGGNLFLNMLGIHLGNVIGLVIGVLLVFYGYQKWKGEDGNGSKLIGLITLLFGTLLLLGSTKMLGGIIVAAIIIYFGYRMLISSTNSNVGVHMEKDMVQDNWTDSFDEEWQRIMKNKYFHS